MNLGILIILISILGYISNWINWRFLNYSAIRLLYYLGAAVHELSHAVFCILTGARITAFSVFSKQPHVTFQKPKLPILGQFLISLAPILGGSAFLFILNKYFLENYFIVPQILKLTDFFLVPFNLLAQLNIFDWQSWLMVFIFLNVGAMIGPSFCDLKNIWPLIIISIFIKWPPLFEFGILILALILTNIILQIILLIIFSVFIKRHN